MHSYAPVTAPESTRRAVQAELMTDQPVNVGVASTGSAGGRFFVTSLLTCVVETTGFAGASW